VEADGGVEGESLGVVGGDVEGEVVVAFGEQGGEGGGEELAAVAATAVGREDADSAEVDAAFGIDDANLADGFGVDGGEEIADVGGGHFAAQGGDGFLIFGEGFGAEAGEFGEGVVVVGIDGDEGEVSGVECGERGGVGFHVVLGGEVAEAEGCGGGGSGWGVAVGDEEQAGSAASDGFVCGGGEQGAKDAATAIRGQDSGGDFEFGTVAVEGGDADELAGLVEEDVAAWVGGLLEHAVPIEFEFDAVGAEDFGGEGAGLGCGGGVKAGADDDAGGWGIGHDCE